jgi:hypothetical protein
MPQSVYNQAMELPKLMLIPKPKVLGDINLHYMTFAEAQLLPFTGEHQSSLKKSALRTTSATKRNEVRYCRM